MTLHFVHVGKTGGTAIKRSLRKAGLAYWPDSQPADVPETPYGRIQLHHHRFRMRDVPPDDFVFFCIRDPIARFVSGFYSRLNKGQPLYYYEWSLAERRAFEAFPTPQLLVAALAGEDVELRRRAQRAMRRIRHIDYMSRSLGTPAKLRARRRQIVYIARQETLAADWERLKAVLSLPPEVRLPGGVRSHRGDASLDTSLDDAAVAALRNWYERDYRLVRFCDQLRAWHGWGLDAGASDGIERLRLQVARLEGLPAVLPAGLRRRLPFR